MTQHAEIHTIKSLLNGEIDNGSPVKIAGWLRSRRTSKGGFSFLEVHDGTCFSAIQAVADSALANYAEIIELGTGCSVTIDGTLVESQGKGQSVEVQATQVTLVGDIDDPETYPIAKKRHTFEYLRTTAHLRPRTNTFGAIARIRHGLAQAVHNYFNSQNFFWVNTPIITSSDCEGAGELFRVSTLDQLARNPDYEQDFFGTETFLTVSGQLNVESYASALTRVYTFGPTFRAENSNTSRHLAEFWMIEPEVAFADLNDIAALSEDFLKFVLRDLLKNYPDDMQFFAERIDKQAITRIESVIDSKFARMSYTDAINQLEAAIEKGQKFEFPISWGDDMNSEHERYLCENVVGGPLVVTDYPKELKAFYMRLNDDDKTVAAMDVLVPGVGELIGGSQREERIEQLDARLTDPTLKEHLWWYRDLRRYGTVPHAGFGLGFERLVLYITGMENIRDAIPFPRVPNNASF